MGGHSIRSATISEPWIPIVISLAVPNSPPVVQPFAGAWTRHSGMSDRPTDCSFKPRHQQITDTLLLNKTERRIRMTVHDHRNTGRRLTWHVARFLIASALLSSVFAGVVSAAPNTDATIVYSFTDCDAHADFQAVKQPSGAASVHLLDGSGNFIFMKAVVLGDQGDLLDGTVLFDTPGITSGNANVETVTCDLVSPSDGLLVRTTGVLTRAH
jgi:hypothetical protein